MTFSQALEHGQSPAGRVLDEQWEDVQSVISEPATASTAPLSPYNPCSSLPSSASRIKANDMNIVDAGNAVTGAVLHCHFHRWWLVGWLVL